MPIGVRVVRGFTVGAAADVTFSNVQLTAPTEYAATQIAANKAYGLRFTAPHAGDFAVQATWTEAYTDDTGVAVTCSGAGTSTLTAAKGSTLTITPPAATKFPAADHVTGTQYNAPVTWRWKCKADTDPTPMKVTVRWEVDMRQLPLYSKGGNAPFRFGKAAQAFTIVNGDPCDVRQAGGRDAKLVQHAVLRVVAGGDVKSGGGFLLISLKGGFRNPNGNKAPLHLGITLQQGARISTRSSAPGKTSFWCAGQASTAGGDPWNRISCSGGAVRVGKSRSPFGAVHGCGEDRCRGATSLLHGHGSYGCHGLPGGLWLSGWERCVLGGRLPHRPSRSGRGWIEPATPRV